MNIYSNYSINFMAGKNTLKTHLSQKAGKTIKDSTTKKSNPFYDDINMFLEKRCTKEEYLKTLVKKVNNSEYNNVILNNPLERKYVNDILTTVDLNRYLKDIPDKYLVDKMKKILESQK